MNPVILAGLPAGAIVGIVLGIVLAVLLIVFICHIRLIHQTEKAIVERLGA